MSRILILDDERKRHRGLKKLLIGHDLTHTYLCKQAVSALQREKFDVAFLDHDLHEEEDGRDFCRWALANPDRCPNKIFIHSHNIWCAEEMKDMLEKMPGGIMIVVKPIPFCAEDPPDEWAVAWLKQEEERNQILIKKFLDLANGLIDA